MEQGAGLLLEGADLTEGLRYSVKESSAFPAYPILSVLIRAPIPARVHYIHVLTGNSMDE